MALQNGESNWQEPAPGRSADLTLLDTLLGDWGSGGKRSAAIRQPMHTQWATSNCERQHQDEPSAESACLGRDVACRFASRSCFLTIPHLGLSLRPVRIRFATAVLLPWLVVGAGICQCLAAIPLSASETPQQDCHSEPAPHSGESDPACGSDCAAGIALGTRAEVRPTGEFSVQQAPALIEVSAEPPGEPARAQAPSRPVAGKAPLCPLYILHSSLLV